MFFRLIGPAGSFCLLFPFLLTGAISLADEVGENLGRLSIDNVVLAAEFELTDSQRGSFDVRESTISFLWEKEDKLSAVFRLGGRKLINPPRIFKKIVIDELGLYEAYAQHKGVYGRWRMGLIPIEFGVDGKVQEDQLDFSRSLIFSQRVIGLRDYGLSYFVRHQNFYTRMAVHNGESDENFDGRVYYTASWGWSQKHLDIGISGHTGQAKPESTLLQESNLGGVDLSLASLWKMGGTYIHWNSYRWDLRLEYLKGALDQKKNPGASEFLSGHADLSYKMGSRTKLMFRYDHLDPNTKVKGDFLKEISLGLVLFGRHNNSRLIFLVTKALEEDVNIPNDRYSLTWKVTPRFFSHIGF